MYDKVHYGLGLLRVPCNYPLLIKRIFFGRRDTCNSADEKFFNGIA